MIQKLFNIKINEGNLFYTQLGNLENKQNQILDFSRWENYYVC